jgi:hypothetical protein
VQAAVRLRLDGSDGAAEHPRDLGFWQVGAVPQRHHDALLSGQCLERLAHLRGERLPVGEVFDHGLGQVVCRRFAAPPGAPPRPVRVHHDRPQVGVRVAVKPQLRPGLVELDQARLDQVLGCVPVAGEQHRYAQVMLAAVTHVGGELFVAIGHRAPFRSVSPHGGPPGLDPGSGETCRMWLWQMRIPLSRLAGSPIWWA